jgi:hypothetical protein
VHFPRYHSPLSSASFTLLSSPVDRGRGQNGGDADADLVLVEEAVVGGRKKRAREKVEAGTILEALTFSQKNAIILAMYNRLKERLHAE